METGENDPAAGKSILHASYQLQVGLTFAASFSGAEKNFMKRSPAAIVNLWFGIIMILAVAFLAATVLFTNVLDDRLYGNKRTIFVVILLAYAAYRGFRLYQVLKRRPDEES